MEEIIGEMIERVNFLYPLTSRNGTTGEELKTWVTSNAIWTKVDENGTKEATKNGRETAIESVTFTMYYNASVKPTWRVKYGSKHFEIKAIQPDDSEMFMQVQAENTEPWRNEYWISPSDGFWTDPLGNYWVLVDRGATKPTFGNLTWTDEDSNSWTTA